MYLVLGVVSLYQSNFEPLAQFDHRHLPPTPTGGGALAGAGKGSGNRGDSGGRITATFAMAGSPEQPPGGVSQGSQQCICSRPHGQL